MSLFPAYSDGSASGKESKRSGQDDNWLSNNSFGFATSSSFKSEQEKQVKPISDENYSGKRKLSRRELKNLKYLKKKRKLKKKKKSKNASKLTELISEDCDLYCVDKTRRTHYLSYSTLTKPVKPRYHVKMSKLIGPGLKIFNKKIKITRYFYKFKKKMKDDDNCMDQKLEVTKKAEEFNKKINNGSDVSQWIEFIEFQDEFFRSQNFSYKTEGERKRGILQKKLDILERALSHNPKSEELLKYWVKIAADILSPNEVLNHLERMIENSPDNLLLWLSLASFRQQSLAICTFPSVAKLYRKGISTLKNMRTNNVSDRDLDVLELLFHYCKFLDHSGQWEILWTIVNKNFHLNFGTEIVLNYYVEDERVKRLEDEIISVDKQPIWVTWRKVELLREGVHFLPVRESVDYPQRCVSTDDIIDFVLHFHRDVHFQLIITFIMLLKVPMLPFNSTMSKVLFKNGLDWTFDSPELILAAVFNSVSTNHIVIKKPAADVKVDYLKFLTQVTRGPQYLRKMEGQSEFLELIQKTFQECTKFLEGKQKIFLGLWWLRFNRWLCILDKNSLASLNVPAKKMKNLFKDFMKNPENRDNLLFYCEYSLFEFNQGNVEASIKTLKTLISARPSVFHLDDDLEKAALCHVYRCLCEIYLCTSQNENAVKLLINLGIGASIDSEVGTDSKKMALEKYEIVTSGLIQEAKEMTDSLENVLLPHFLLEWVHCYLWLLGLTQPIALVKSHSQKISADFENCDNLFSILAREFLFEARSLIFWTLEKYNVLSITYILRDGLNQFPKNLTMLSMLASKKLEEHGLWWSFKQSFLNPPTIFGCIILICVALARKEIDKESFGNRLKSLFYQLTLSHGRLSSVIHCLRLMFLFDFDNSQLVNAQINAVESCPWNKSIYMGAIAVMPNKLMELTDIMVEKELRVHITPDEIQEMRD